MRARIQMSTVLKDFMQWVKHFKLEVLSLTVYCNSLNYHYKYWFLFKMAITYSGTTGTSLGCGSVFHYVSIHSWLNLRRIPCKNDFKTTYILSLSVWYCSMVKSHFMDSWINWINTSHQLDVNLEQNKEKIDFLVSTTFEDPANENGLPTKNFF